MQSFIVEFDNGNKVEVALKSRDLAVLERDGFNIEESPPMKGSYTLAFTALQRMKRNGDLDFEIPSTLEGLMDVADLEPVEDLDAKGEGSGQALGSG